MNVILNGKLNEWQFGKYNIKIRIFIFFLNYFTACTIGASDGALSISGSFYVRKKGLEFAEIIRMLFLMVNKRNDDLVNMI